MKKSLFLLALFASFYAYAQVGINTETPQASLEILAMNPTGNTTNVEGLLIPRIDRQRAQSMTGVTTSTLIYVNDVATGTQAGTAINIDAPGYYYFDETNVWTKLKTPANASDINIYKDDGTLLSNRTVTQEDKTLAFTSTATTGNNHFSVDGSTLSVDAVNNRIGIGNTAPAANLDVTGNIKITDGTEGDRKVLTSDANGLASWQPVATSTVDGELLTTSAIVPLTMAAGGKNMGPNITLSEGKWIVYLGFLIHRASAPNSLYAARFTLSSSATAIEETGFQFTAGNKLLLSTFSTGGAGAKLYSFFASGVIRVNVTAQTLKLYLWDHDTYLFDEYTGINSPYITNSGENYIFAIRSN